MTDFGNEFAGQFKDILDQIMGDKGKPKGSGGKYPFPVPAAKVCKDRRELGNWFKEFARAAGRNHLG